MDREVDLNAVDEYGSTPLLFAALRSNKSMVKLFVKLVEDLKSCDENKKQILHYSSSNGWLGVVKCLVSNGCDINAKEIFGDVQR